jgi:phosphoribosylformylglycinamidine synthase subunit PurSL
MLWELEIKPLGRDTERERVCDEFDLFTHSTRGGDLIKGAAKGYLLKGDLEEAQAERLQGELLVDTVVETSLLREISPMQVGIGNPRGGVVTVLFKPGVMDPVAQSILAAAGDLQVPLDDVRTFRRYFISWEITEADLQMLSQKILANDAIEQIVIGSIKEEHLRLGSPYQFQLVTVPLLNLDEVALEKLSKEGQLALNLEEMKTIQKHFQKLRRDPIDIELETIAQTWSEHCSHKTLKGSIDYTETVQGQTKKVRFQNLLKETIFGATQELRKRWGNDDWCVSVFSDNAGVVRFNDDYHVCFKVETHNHPSAIEPYGGANTGLGGVIRDPLGTGLGAKPICNTDVFCFAPPDFPPEQLPQGVLHPRRVMQGVVRGVKDYGNRMGIPTVNGAVIFDERYLANPLVYCGTVGLIPIDCIEKAARPGDLIVAVGGRTGRDGIHGATFSSLELTHESDKVSGGAVQIGNAITEKKVLDVILAARDQNLYSAITDCGAGGFSSAVGEMAAELGAVVHLEKAPLKYEGLSYTEIWISESQERMVLAVPPENWETLHALCDSEQVEAAVLGQFEATGKLRLLYDNQPVGELEMHFLHDGRPNQLRSAEWVGSTNQEASTSPSILPPADSLLKILSSYSVASKEWIIRQYDHEVQGGTVIKPLVGVKEDGPGDASVIVPVLDSYQGLAIGNGLNPLYGDLDPYWMAANAIDEAVRNVVAVGADPSRIAILDNFCWGNVNDPKILGELVRTSIACREVALAYQTPFISGKDSLNNQYTSNDRRISIPGTLLISAMGLVRDVRNCLTMDLKKPGNKLFLIGVTKLELGGSHYHKVNKITGGEVPKVDLKLAPKIFAAIHTSIEQKQIRSCHDLSEGGLAVAIAEMCFSGNIGADLTGLKNLAGAETLSDPVRLFSESATRFLVEIEPDRVDAFRHLFSALPLTELGVTVAEPRLRIAGENGEWLIWAKLSELKEAWQKPLRW